MRFCHHLLLLTCMGASPIHAASFVSQMNAWTEQQLSANSSSLMAYVFLWIGGIAASLLPCVYPLYPITINILKARGTEAKRFVHPLVYFAGIASMYFVFGLIAGTTGGAFNELLRLPLTNTFIAVVLVILGLSSAELLMIPLFSGAHGDSKYRGTLGTYLMGLSAGLLSSACVGPIVVSILVGIASNTATIGLTGIITASIKLLCFGIGVGMPFLLLGVLGAKIPKAGHWMKYVQYAFSALVIYFAYSYLEKGLLGFGFEDSTVLAIAIGALILVTAIYQLQKEELFPHQKMRTALFALAAITGVLIMFRSFSVNPVLNAQSTLPSYIGGPNSEQKGKLTWYTDRETAYAEAKKKGKLVFLDFHGNWCTNCKAFQQITQDDRELNEAMQNAVLYKIYDTAPEFEKYKSDPRFPELKVGLPFFVITDTDGNMLYKTNDYQKTKEMALFLKD